MIGFSRIIGRWSLAVGLVASSAGVLFGESSEAIVEDGLSEGMSNWIVEQQPGGSVSIEGGRMTIEDAKGCTVWFKEKLEAPVRISYRATISSDGRVSDMNCFWMASDPRKPEDLFYEGHGRTGAFADYDALQLYYVGYGGNHNSTTRFRRYLGDGEKPLHEGYDLGKEPYLLKPDHDYLVELIADEDGARYYRDGELIFEYKDADPLKRGWFGFRTVWSRMEISDFQIERLQVKGTS